MAEILTSADTEKPCRVCGELKVLAKFPKAPKARDGRAHRCYACAYEARGGPSPKDAERAKLWKKGNPERSRELKREHSQRARRREGCRPLAEIRAEAQARQIEQDRHRQTRKQSRAEVPWRVPGLTAGERWAIRYKTDPGFNLRERVRTAFRHKREGARIGELLRSNIARGGRSRLAERQLGYSISELIRHLERQFTAGMTWPVFMTGAIHIDHIVPLAKFDRSDPQSLRAAWGLPNLRPMWTSENIAKGARVTLLL